MRKLLTGAFALLLSAAVAPALPRQDRDDRHDDERHDEGKNHDNGRHEGWDRHRDQVREDHSEWDYEHERMHPGERGAHGEYVVVKKTIVLRGYDRESRRVILNDHSNWIIASHDLERCRDWRWDRDSVYVYADEVHPGWYVLFNARLGRFVHVEYFGSR